MLRDLLKRLAGSGTAPAGIADRLIAEGNGAEDAGRLEEACARYREAVQAAPGYAKAHLNLGIGLEAAGAVAQAALAYEAALALDPSEPYACYNYGKLLHGQGDAERAERLLRTALDGKPGFPEARVVLSNVLDARGDFAGATVELEAALLGQPDNAGAWYNYGDVLLKLGRRADAEAALRRALQIAPGYVLAAQLLGNLLRGDSRIAEALAVFGATRACAPQAFDLQSAELYTLNFSEEMSAADVAERHLEFGARIEAARPARFAPFSNSREPQRRLRIGYLSADFHFHVVALFMQPVLERHDRSRYEIFCYYTGRKVDDYTRRLSAHADVWRWAVGRSPGALAETISNDEIDVLVDLAGQSSTPQLAVFAQRPAPVQVTWLGYQNTTGLTRIDYRLCDGVTDPPGETEHLHSEKLLRLPHSLWCYRPVLSAEAAMEPPCRRYGYITFGSFNDAPKISMATRRMWAEILAGAPDSRLLVVGVPEGRAQETLLSDLAALGVAASRISIAPRVPLDRYFRWFDAVDIALDTTPYSGHTTTCDTLWMGVPVVTLAGGTSVSRGAASILAAAGLEEWVARSPAEYVRLALAGASDSARLTQLRRTLRPRLRTSPLMDEVSFVNGLERAYRDMWRQWCEAAGG